MSLHGALDTSTQIATNATLVFYVSAAKKNSRLQDITGEKENDWPS